MNLYPSGRPAPWLLGALALFLALSPPARAARYVYEGFDYQLNQFIGYVGEGGYGLLGDWASTPFQLNPFPPYQLAEQSLVGGAVVTTDTVHLLRPSGGDLATITREIALPIGAPGTTRYLGFLVQMPSSSSLRPRPLIFGVELQGPQTGIYVGARNDFGVPRFCLALEGGGTAPATAPGSITANQTYFCVVKLQFNAVSTTCSLYVGGNESNLPDAVRDIPAGLLRTVAVTSNYQMRIDELRIADSIAELRQSASAFPPSLQASAVSIQEGNSATQATVTFTLSKAPAFDAIATYNTAPGTANDNDFVPQSGRIHFAPGETKKNLTIDILGDTAVEPNETFFISVSRRSGIGTAGIATGGVQVTLVNDDVAPADVHISVVKFDSDYYLDWNQTPQRSLLQQSSDLIEWTNVSPAIGSNDPSGTRIDATATARFYRFIYE